MDNAELTAALARLKERIGVAELARRLDYHEATVGRVILGKQTPGRKLRLATERLLRESER